MPLFCLRQIVISRAFPKGCAWPWTRITQRHWRSVPRDSRLLVYLKEQNLVTHVISKVYYLWYVYAVCINYVNSTNETIRGGTSFKLKFAFLCFLNYSNV